MSRGDDKERDLGPEMVRTFGVRLRRIYTPDDQGMPQKMAETLDRLRGAEQAAEQAKPAGSAPTEQQTHPHSQGPASFGSDFFPWPR